MLRPGLALLLLSAVPVQAETFTAASRVTRVTLYAPGASVERVVTLDLPPGSHEIIIPDLPLNTTAEALDVRAPDTLAIGAISLLTDRLPPSDTGPAPEVEAAEAAVKVLEAALRATDARIAGTRLKGEAAREQIAALHALTQTDTPPATPEALRALAATVGTEALAALQTAQAAEAEAVEAEIAREDDVKALEDAQAAYAALTTGEVDHAALVLDVESSGGPVEITIVTLSEEASWMPAYDFRLTTEPVALSVDRGVLVSQYTGEDWTDVALTVSTASPFTDNAPYPLSADLRRIAPEQPPMTRADGEAGGAPVVVDEPAPVVAEASGMMTVNWQGATVTYSYPKPVTIRNGSDRLRLHLDSLGLAPDLFALAVPLQDDRGYVMAEVTNSGAEPLLPGSARYYRDGALVGGGDLELLAAGDKAELGFGRLDSLLVSREIPNRSEGDRGVFTASTERTETAVITVKNLSPRAWPLRIRDRVPYSEQEDLAITYTATPPETDRDMDGQRGLLEWRTDLAAGATQEIRLEHSLSWPEGMVLE
jgi:uncharacterized protein (TIGR02231 family)